MRFHPFLSLSAAVLWISCITRPAPQETRKEIEIPGARADGSILLPNQWSLRPAGKQILLGDFPVNIAVHPSSKFAAVLHAGYGTHEIVIVSVAQSNIVSRVSINEAFYGLEFSSDGSQLFSSGAGNEVIHAFDFKEGYLNNHRAWPLRDVKQRGIPGGISINNQTQKLLVANVWGHRISQVDLTGAVPPLDIPLIEGIRASNPAVPPSDADVAAGSKRAEAVFDPTLDTDPFPYTCKVDERRQRLYVSLWAQSSVAVIDLASSKVIAKWKTEEHPNEMALSKSGQYLFVANGNRNTVSVLDTATGSPIETISTSLDPQAYPGSTPNSIAFSPDEKILFVANACNNDIAVFDIATPGKSKSLGFIPTGWYPTSVRMTPDGKHLLVANGKGIISKSNRNGPQVGKEPPSSVLEYIGGLLQGTMSIIEIPSREKFLEQMAGYTAKVYSCSPAKTVASTETPNAIPVRPGDPSPIKYCIYIVKENRTYDQVLGDMRQGNGDPTLCLFPAPVTPNHHKLAEEFVLLDNFYVESEVSADGHEWTMGAYASDFVEKFWPLSYGHNKQAKYPYLAEGNFRIAEPASGYLWDRAREAGVSYRSYGEFISNGKTTNDVSKTRVKSLEGHFDNRYRGFDLDYPDVSRADRFISELRRFEKEGEMPQLQILRLPNDHTHGTAVGKLTPSALVADNDLALGMVIEAVSHSRFWPRTAVFVVEDDAQNGPDHVDAHRTVAFAISPYVKRGSVDSTMYSTSSMLRTMEHILGLKPMSQFDAAATPMLNSFQAKPDPRPYKAVPVNVDRTARNLKTAWGGKISDKMNFAKEDAADDLVLNEVIWRSIRGAQSPMPPPTHAAFVFVHAKGDDDD